jgi:hypothetical protein
MPQTNASLADMIGALKAAGRMAPDDVIALRAQVYGADAVTAEALEALAGLDGAIAQPPGEWVEFLAEAMTDYVVRQAAPEGYVDDARADWLMGVLAEPSGAAGMEVLARILETADETPPKLAAFALSKIKAAVTADGKVSAEDVAMMRRLVFAGGGEDAVGVTREEAEALFDVDDACRAGPNDAAWPDFFAKAVGASLTAVSPFHAASRADVVRDETWLSDRENMVDFATSMLRKPDVAGAVREVLHPYQDEENEWRDAEAGAEAAEAQALPISDEEARWLVGRLSKGALSEAERRLIAFLKDVAPHSGLLKPLLDAGVPVATPAPLAAPEPVEPGEPEPAQSGPLLATGTFGHRRVAPT